MNELQYQDVSTYLRAWYKGKKNDSPIELGSDLGLLSSKQFTIHKMLTGFTQSSCLTYIIRYVKLIVPRGFSVFLFLRKIDICFSYVWAVWRKESTRQIPDGLSTTSLQRGCDGPRAV